MRLQYITGIHALNLHTIPDVCGDWHRGALDWTKAQKAETTKSPWGDYGIIKNRMVLEMNGTHNVANTIRALLDMIDARQFAYAKGMREDYICNDKYTQEVFEKVLVLRNRPYWHEIDTFMQREYFMEWVKYVELQQ